MREKLKVVLGVVKACHVRVLARLEELCEDVNLVLVVAISASVDKFKQFSIGELHLLVCQIAQN